MSVLVQIFMAAGLIAVFIVLRLVAERLLLRARLRHGKLAADCDRTNCMSVCHNNPEQRSQ